MRNSYPIFRHTFRLKLQSLQKHRAGKLFLRTRSSFGTINVNFEIYHHQYIFSYFLLQLLKPEDRNVLQMKDHAAIFGNGYYGPDEYAAAQDEGYVVPFDRRDADSRMARNFYRQQQITKT